jgi:hypothetical protein
MDSVLFAKDSNEFNLLFRMFSNNILLICISFVVFMNFDHKIFEINMFIKKKNIEIINNE